MSEAPRQRVGPIGKILYDSGVVSREQVTEALEIQRQEGGKTFEILVRLGHLSKDDLHAVLSQQAGVASIDLARFKVSSEFVGLIPKELALRELVLPIDRMGKLLSVAMACPLDVTTIEQIEEMTGLRVKALLCKYDDIVAAVEKYYPKVDGGVVEMHTFEMPTRHAASPVKNCTEDVKQLDMLAAAPGLLDKILELTVPGKVDLKAVMQTASADPALVGWLLALANSPAYGMYSQVDSLGLALTLLGGEGTRSGVEQLKKLGPQPKADFGAAYESSRKASLIAATLAKKSGRVERGTAYTAGLLRRLGWFALATVTSAEYLGTSQDEATQCEEERKRYGLSHLEAGSIVANRWRYPQSLVAAVGMPVGSDTDAPNLLAAIAELSTALAERGAASGVGALAGHEQSLSALGLDSATALKEAEKILAS